MKKPKIFIACDTTNLNKIKRIIKKGETCVGLADGILLTDGKEIYNTKNLKVGLFKSGIWKK